MAEVLCTVIVVSRCIAMITQVLLTLGASSILPAAEDQFQKFHPQISLLVTEVSVEVGRVDDVTCEQPLDLM